MTGAHASDRELIEAMTEIATLRTLAVNLSREVVALKAAAADQGERLRKAEEGISELFDWLREVHQRQPEVPEEVLAKALALIDEQRR